jgi:hypothetical protein
LLSQQLKFVEITQSGECHQAGYAPYLDYERPREEEREKIETLLDSDWLTGDLEKQARRYAIGELVPNHLKEVRTRREHFLNKTRNQVHDRLKREISYWDNRMVELETKERAGKSPGKLNSTIARRRRDGLTERLNTRMLEIEQEKQISALPPVIIGGALVIPERLLREQVVEPEHSAVVREDPPEYGYGVRNTEESELLAMDSVMDYERSLGNEPIDISHENRGYDIESRDGKTKNLRFIEVKGRHPSALKIMLTRNELLCALNEPERWMLAYVAVENGKAQQPIYATRPFHDGVPFNASTFKVEIAKLLEFSD